MIAIANVYIVEDDDDLQEIYRMFLSRMGHEVVGQIADADEALVDLYFNHKEIPPDILIVDNNLPGKSGLNLLEDLNKLKSLNKTQVLFISGSSGIRFDALNLGASRFIQKPFNFNLLGRIITDVMRENSIKLQIPSD
ncbi:MAG: response regulator [Candidatus Heimdallarchaeota archaeon]